MLAIVTIFLLLFEICFYAWLGRLAVTRFGGPFWLVILAIPVCMSLTRMLVVLRAFIISSKFSDEDPAVRKLGILGWGKLIYSEWRGALLLYSLLQPLEPFLNRRDASPSAKGTPVLLLHGLLCNGNAWWWMRRALARHGITRCYTLNMEPVFGDIDEYGPLLARRVEEISAATGHEKIILIGHSMGGLVSRVYLHRLDGAKRVVALLTLGSPHHGTVLATPPVSENIRQMQLNNPWLAELNTSEAQPAPVPITSIYTAHDNLVSPQGGSRLAYAENIRLTGVGHVGLQFSEEVAALVSGFIRKHSTR